MSAETGGDLPGLAGRALNAFAESATRTRDRDALMDSAFAALFDLYRATTPAHRSSTGFREFVGKLAELLAQGNNPDRLGLYVVRSETAAENGRHEGYRPACWRRSMLQILGDEFVPWSAVLRSCDVDAITRIDGALAEVAVDAGITNGDEVPSWVPESHWWWWEPVRLRSREGGAAPGGDPDGDPGGATDPDPGPGPSPQWTEGETVEDTARTEG